MTDTPTDAAPRPAAADLAPPDEAVRAMVIVNAQAGLGLWPGALPAIERLAAAGWRADVIRTETEGHAFAPCSYSFRGESPRRQRNPKADWFGQESCVDRNLSIRWRPAVTGP